MDRHIARYTETAKIAANMQTWLNQIMKRWQFKIVVFFCYDEKIFNHGSECRKQ
ncbi:MAG TPA: hypothetical protein VIM70_10270 [Clostridium sp.]|uniref:hypothetical protein n=1 Tax=Clostridium sp. TaxID=1506 RepID=UPI002F9319C6